MSVARLGRHSRRRHAVAGKILVVDAEETKALEDIQKYGCHVIHVLEEGEYPRFTYSIGIEQQTGQPELIVTGLKRELAHSIISAYSEKVSAGEVFGQHVAATCALMLASVFVRAASAADAIRSCSPMPALVHSSQPEYPPIIETRGLPSPVSIVVEFTVTPEGHASDILIIETDAGTYAKEFNARAIQSVATWRFERIPEPCRGRAKVVFKIAGQ